MYWHCRLCAESKASQELFDLNIDQAKCNELLVKLSFLNAVYVDISDRFDLPKAVCFVCDESLTKAYEFLIKVKNAQNYLNAIFPSKEFHRSYDVDQKPGKLLHNVKQESFQEDNFSKTFQNSTLTALYPKYKERSHITELTIEADPIHSEDDGWNCDSILKKTLLAAPSPIPLKSQKVRRSAKKEEFPTDIEILSWKQYRWTCGLCYIELPDIDTLRAHSITAHNKCAEYACFICEKIFNFNSFVLHAKGHHICLRNRCHYCDAAVDPEELDSHLNQHLESQKPCPACGVTFPDDTSLQKHLNSVVQKKPPKKGKWIKASEKDRTCETCGKVFKHVCLLKKHVEIHNNDRKREFACEQCGNMFYSKNDLKLHFVTHREERLHVCSICNTSFKHAGNMREHVKIHTNEKPFSCETCGRRFRRQTQLDIHKVRHTDLCPFVCTLCDKRFHFKACLVKHERQHTGFKPYSCDECERQFADWGNFNKHMKRRHNKDMSKKRKLSVVDNLLDET